MRRALLIVLLGLGLARPARAWDAATTHAGLTERAALASSLLRRFAALFGAPNGLFQTLRLDVRDERGARLRERLARLDPTGGAAPDAGRLTALGWLVAGSIVEEVPPDRRRNHFFDPTTGRGLRQGGPLASLGFGLAAVSTGADSMRDLFAGEAFDGNGAASVAWLAAPGNDLGLGRFLDARERAVIAATPAERESALADALLVAGALLHVVEDAAAPAYVHNDFKTDLYDAEGPLVSFAAARYGRLAVPAPAGDAVPVAHLADLIHTADGAGLADRVARHWFSLGQLRGDDRVTAPADMPALAAPAGARGYLYDEARRHLARFARDRQGRVTWDLDDRCHADYAAALLPEAGRGALSALEHLFRDPLALDKVSIKNGPLALGAGKLTILVEDNGTRRVVSQVEVSGAEAGAVLAPLPDETGDARVIAVFRGVDGAGEPVVTHVERAAK